MAETVSLHVWLPVNVVSTLVIGNVVTLLAEEFQRPPVSLAVDRYGQIRLPEYAME